MKFHTTLQEGLFLKRYKRFFADVRLSDEVAVAHVPNTGSLKGCIEREAPCLVSSSDDPKRKLRHTLQMIQTPTSWVGVNTALPSQLVWELWKTQPLAHWQTFDCGQMEVKISTESRIDLVLWDSQKSYPAGEKLTLQHCEQNAQPLHFIEIKNVTLSDGCTALFPDCESIRAQKHVRELMTLVERGHTAEFVFVIQREDCEIFRAAHELDPKYAQLLEQAHRMGVRVTPLACTMSPNEIRLRGEVLRYQIDTCNSLLSP